MSQKFTPGLLLVVSCMMVGCTVNVTNPVTSVGVRANVPISAGPQAMAPNAAASSFEPVAEATEAPVSTARSMNPVMTEVTPMPVSATPDPSHCSMIWNELGSKQALADEGCPVPSALPSRIPANQK